MMGRPDRRPRQPRAVAARLASFTGTTMLICSQPASAHASSPTPAARALLSAVALVTALAAALGFAPAARAATSDAVVREGAAAVATLRHGPLVVSVNAAGLLVGAPDHGVATVDGPLIALADPARGAEADAAAGAPAEWAGVSFDTPAGHASYAACGNAADWSHRTPVVVTGLDARDDGAVSVVQA
ncbi:MAG: hypothetical protein ABI624_15630, partial [Casimicrobiaceae bacterium]